ncbi:DEAD/DEAH box helicase [Oricola nitratireducens]|uniref:DEAD/DEAH box helicase n=1 Tax=Oricola nitratireducens TaxID=2775868 RepID=UPI00186948DD|nr:DEAD/DEAH box helicase [Oricola nitratireducens]
MAGQDLGTLLSRVSIDTINDIVEDDIVSLIKSISSASDVNKNVRSAALLLIDTQPESHFAEAKFRSIILNSMEESALASLAARIGFKGDIKKFDPSRDADVFKQYLGFFGFVVDEPVAFSEIQANETLQPNFGLFDHQRDAVDRVWRVVGAGHGRVILHMPTGAGKTRSAMHLICRYLIEHEPGIVVWLANSSELLDQGASAFQEAWKNLGNRPLELKRMWGRHDPDMNDFTDGLLVGGFQKLHAYFSRNPTALLKIGMKTTLVVVDEAHQGIAPTYRDVINQLANAGKKSALVGLTATPGRTWSDVEEDEKLSDFFENRKVVLRVEGWDNPVNYLIESGYLAKPNFKRIEVPTELSTEPSGKGDEYSDDIIDELCNSSERNKVIIEEIRALTADGHKRIMLFAASVKHAATISAVLNVMGIESHVVTGTSTERARQRAIRAFKSNKSAPIVLSNFGVLTTGFDAPKTSAAIIARPTKSLVLYSQMVGRATRGVKAGGNKECTISTIVDTSLPGFGDMAEAFENWEDVWREH